jgi:hypothetical protein
MPLPCNINSLHWQRYLNAAIGAKGLIRRSGNGARTPSSPGLFGLRRCVAGALFQEGRWR